MRVEQHLAEHPLVLVGTDLYAVRAAECPVTQGAIFYSICQAAIFGSIRQGVRHDQKNKRTEDGAYSGITPSIMTATPAAAALLLLLLLPVVDPHASPAERIGERMLFVEKVVERVERIRAALVCRGFLDGEIGREKTVGKPLCCRCDFVTLVVNVSIHGRRDDRARVA